MKRTSTRNCQTMTQTSCCEQVARGPKQQTLALLRQFARAYAPVDKMPGLILN